MDRQKALSLLSSGISQSIVASTLGVSESQISQLMTDDDFLAELSQEKYEKLKEQTARDAKYDELEDSLISQLTAFVGTMIDPVKISKVLGIINNAKRRGADAITQQQAQGGTIVNLNLPKACINSFVLNVNNQIISDGEREFRTISSSQFVEENKKCIPNLQNLTPTDF